MIVDLFAGPGGWDWALAGLGLESIGIEYDGAACETRAAVGYPTVRADVRTCRPPAQLDGLIASPPCPTFSTAGKGEGRDYLPELCLAVLACADGWHPDTDLDLFGDPRTGLVLEPLRWIHAGRPDWVALEQVPPVLPVWSAYATVLERLGYSTWTGILNAADYGVPQTRRRAILLASRTRTVRPPQPTHGERPADSLFAEYQLAPWVSMAQALGWGMTGRPSTTLVTGVAGHACDPLSGGSGSRAALARELEEGRWRMGFPRLDDHGDSEDGYRERDWREADEPAFALTEKARSWVIQTGNNSHVTSRDGSRAGEGGVELYERSLEEPAPTLDAKVGSAWRVQFPGGRNGAERTGDEPAATIAFGHDAGAWRVTGVNTGRDWKEGGTREDAQTIPPDQPAPAIDGKGRWHALVEADVWPEDRPATTLAGDARVFAPGGHVANDGRNNDEMIGRSEHAIRLGIADALILQSFPPDYPVAGSKTKQFEQVGNAVPPGLARAILLEVLDG